MRRLNFGLSIFLICLLACSCKTEDVVETGSIVGFVNMYDENNSTIQDKSGVIISIDGLPSITTTSKRRRPPS